jgi:hypothetical protein
MIIFIGVLHIWFGSHWPYTCYIGQLESLRELSIVQPTHTHTHTRKKKKKKKKKKNQQQQQEEEKGEKCISC